MQSQDHAEVVLKQPDANQVSADVLLDFLDSALVARLAENPDADNAGDGGQIEHGPTGAE